jgi:hypothetical protein
MLLATLVAIVWLAVGFAGWLPPSYLSHPGEGGREEGREGRREGGVEGGCWATLLPTTVPTVPFTPA